MTAVVHVPRRLAPGAWGGTERLLAAVLPRLAARGYPGAILTSAIGSRPGRDRFAGAPVRRFPSFYPEWPLAERRRRAYDAIGGNLVSPALTRALEHLPALGLVHLHAGGRLGASCLAVARRRGVACVLTLHGGHFARPPARGTPGGERGPVLPWGKLLSWRWEVRQLHAQVDALICVGPDEYAAARAALPDARVRFLPGAVDPAPFAEADGGPLRAELGLGYGDRVLLCPARLDRDKDQATLVRAWRRLDRDDVHLALVGAETTAGYARELRALAGDRVDRLHVPGNRPPDELPRWYAAADLVVLPSRYEPFGLVICEAWAAGRAVVAARTGGPAWMPCRHARRRWCSTSRPTASAIPSPTSTPCWGRVTWCWRAS